MGIKVKILRRLRDRLEGERRKHLEARLRDAGVLDQVVSSDQDTISGRLSLSGWPSSALEDFEERAGIMEHDGGLPRGQAEAKAFEIVRRNGDLR